MLTRQQFADSVLKPAFDKLPKSDTEEVGAAKNIIKKFLKDDEGDKAIKEQWANLLSNFFLFQAPLFIQEIWKKTEGENSDKATWVADAMQFLEQEGNNAPSWTGRSSGSYYEDKFSEEYGDPYEIKNWMKFYAAIIKKAYEETGKKIKFGSNMFRNFNMFNDDGFFVFGEIHRNAWDHLFGSAEATADEPEPDEDDDIEQESDRAAEAAADEDTEDDDEDDTEAFSAEGKASLTITDAPASQVLMFIARELERDVNSLLKNPKQGIKKLKRSKVTLNMKEVSAWDMLRELGRQTGVEFNIPKEKEPKQKAAKPKPKLRVTRQTKKSTEVSQGGTSRVVGDITYKSKLGTYRQNPHTIFSVMLYPESPALGAAFSDLKAQNHPLIKKMEQEKTSFIDLLKKNDPTALEVLKDQIYFSKENPQFKLSSNIDIKKELLDKLPKGGEAFKLITMAQLKLNNLNENKKRAKIKIKINESKKKSKKKEYSKLDSLILREYRLFKEQEKLPTVSDEELKKAQDEMSGLADAVDKAAEQTQKEAEKIQPWKNMGKNAPEESPIIYPYLILWGLAPFLGVKAYRAAIPRVKESIYNRKKFLASLRNQPKIVRDAARYFTNPRNKLALGARLGVEGSLYVGTYAAFGPFWTLSLAGLLRAIVGFGPQSLAELRQYLGALPSQRLGVTQGRFIQLTDKAISSVSRLQGNPAARGQSGGPGGLALARTKVELNSLKTKISKSIDELFDNLANSNKQFRELEMEDADLIAKKLAPTATNILNYMKKSTDEIIKSIEQHKGNIEAKLQTIKDGLGGLPKSEQKTQALKEIAEIENYLTNLEKTHVFAKRFLNKFGNLDHKTSAHELSELTGFLYGFFGKRSKPNADLKNIKTARKGSRDLLKFAKENYKQQTITPLQKLQSWLKGLTAFSAGASALGVAFAPEWFRVPIKWLEELLGDYDFIKEWAVTLDKAAWWSGAWLPYLFPGMLDITRKEIEEGSFSKLARIHFKLDKLDTAALEQMVRGDTRYLESYLREMYKNIYIAKLFGLDTDGYKKMIKDKASAVLGMLDTFNADKTIASLCESIDRVSENTSDEMRFMIDEINQDTIKPSLIAFIAAGDYDKSKKAKAPEKKEKSKDSPLPNIPWVTDTFETVKKKTEQVMKSIAGSDEKKMLINKQLAIVFIKEMIRLLKSMGVTRVDTKQINKFIKKRDRLTETDIGNIIGELPKLPDDVIKYFVPDAYTKLSRAGADIEIPTNSYKTVGELSTNNPELMEYASYLEILFKMALKGGKDQYHFINIDKYTPALNKDAIIAKIKQIRAEVEARPEVTADEIKAEIAKFKEEQKAIKQGWKAWRSETLLLTDFNDALVDIKKNLTESTDKFAKNIGEQTKVSLRDAFNCRN